MKKQLSVVSGQLSDQSVSSLHVNKGPGNHEELASDVVRLPASQKIYVENLTNGHALRVPFREIKLSPSTTMDGRREDNASIRVYDTSGPWTVPNFSFARRRVGFCFAPYTRTSEYSGLNRL